MKDRQEEILGRLEAITDVVNNELTQRALKVLIDFYESGKDGGLSNKKLARALGCSRNVAKNIRQEISIMAGFRRGF